MKKKHAHKTHDGNLGSPANPLPCNADEEAGLGESLYLWKYGWAMRLILSLLSLLLLGSGWSMHNEGMGEGLWMGLTFGLPLALFALRSWTSTFEIFENGVRRRSWGFARELRYDQIESMVFWTREEQDWNVGGDTGPSSAGYRIHIRLYPIDGAGLKTVGFDHYRLADIDCEFDALQDRLTKEVSGRMLRRIAAGERVPWGRHAVMTRQGLYFRRRKWFFFRGPEESLEQSAFYKGIMEGGKFRIYELGWNRPIFSISEREPNFHAGALIFSTIRYQTDLYPTP